MLPNLLPSEDWAQLLQNLSLVFSTGLFITDPSDIDGSALSSAPAEYILLSGSRLV
jgi:hypothetical protein